MDAIAQGRVWDGGTARQNGLVDQFGGLDDALAFAAKQAGLKDGAWHADFKGQDADPYGSLLSAFTGDEEDSVPTEGQDFVGMAALSQRALVGQALSEVERLLGARGAQAYCLECPVPVHAAQSSRGELGMIARIAELIGLIA